VERARNLTGMLFAAPQEICYMRFPALLACLALAFPLAACDSSPQSSDIPAVRYTSTLNAMGKSSGSLAGQIVFPSAYSQHSTTFYVDDLAFATQPDGRFWVRTIPAGSHQLRVFQPGFDAIVRTVLVHRSELQNVQRLVLHPAWGKVVGRVVNESGESAPGVVVRLKSYGLASATDRDGIFQFLGLGAGDHVLDLDGPGYEPLRREVRLQGNEARNLGLIRVQRRINTANELMPDAQRAGG
jgi:Carboxypeptidase regulatory-like domain